MNCKRIVWYSGSDDELARALQPPLARIDCRIERVLDAASLAEQSAVNWYRVVLFDGDISRTPVFDQVRQLRQRNAGVPVIVVAPLEGLRVTQVALARSFGAEALFFKPLEEPQALVEVVGSAFDRLDGWRRALDYSEEVMGLSDHMPREDVATSITG
jgi:DNA-binding NtrC family response regulator